MYRSYLTTHGFLLHRWATSSVATTCSRRCATMAESSSLRFIDIGANLNDDMFKGVYHGKSYHEGDLELVLERSWAVGVTHIIVTATNLEEARGALAMARQDARLYCTAGVHPTRCTEIRDYPEGPDAYLQQLDQVITEGKACGKLVAYGEFGLDYDRLHFCDKDTQLKYFARQFALAEKHSLPLFLHMRAAAADFMDVISKHVDSFPAGVVHSFTGSAEEARGLLGHDKLMIGVNGCSLKTEENLEVVRGLPLDRLVLETDSPWCGITSTHASRPLAGEMAEAKDKKKFERGKHVKGRNEPGNIVNVCAVVSSVLGVAPADVAAAAYANTQRVYFGAKVAVGS